MAFSEVYINNTSSFFPNEPVSNDDMEGFLGYINNKPSKSKRIVLRNNGIKTVTMPSPAMARPRIPMPSLRPKQ